MRFSKASVFPGDFFESVQSRTLHAEPNVAHFSGRLRLRPGDEYKLSDGDVLSIGEEVSLSRSLFLFWSPTSASVSASNRHTLVLDNSPMGTDEESPCLAFEFQSLLSERVSAMIRSRYCSSTFVLRSPLCRV